MVAFPPLPVTLDQHGISMAARNAQGEKWATSSLAYAREHGQARMERLLETVRVEIVLDAELIRAREQARRELRSRVRKAERDEARRAEWESFMEKERRELQLRKDGQLGRLLGGQQPQDLPEALRRLASEDRKQAEVGLVALMSNGKVVHKRLDELSEEDMAARDAANRSRITWLKERLDGWIEG